MATIKLQWYPQPRQLTFLRACGMSHPFDDSSPGKPQAKIIGYGGAAGGGKSDALMGCAIIAGLTYPRINIGYFRRRFTQLEGPGGAVMRSHQLLTGWCRWQGQFRRWTFPTGAVLQFCHVDSEAELENFQSQQFDILLFDEATQFTENMVRYLINSRLRATTDGGLIPFAGMATNPGSIGHGWFKRNFISAGEWETPHDVEVQPGIFERHIFVPAKLSDNQILERRDPSYRASLEALPEVQRRQLLDGDWDVFAGQYYPEWNSLTHVVDPFEIPNHWQKFRSLDYGLDCTACYWWAIDQSQKCFIYREIYQPNLSLSEAAALIVSNTPEYEKIRYTVASPDLWNRRQDSKVEAWETMRKSGLGGLQKADDSRIQGWRALREYLKPYDDPNIGRKTARLQVFSTCRNLIRTLPELIFDENDVEDVSDSCEDHGPESIRYGVMSRPPITISDEDREKRNKEYSRMTRPRISSKTGY